MPKRTRPQTTTRSEHWLRKFVNNPQKRRIFDTQICSAFEWDSQEKINWFSPLLRDKYVEYYDQEFLNQLGLKNLKIPLGEFWPNGGPRWDALAKTNSGKVLLVEAKAHIDECLDYGSKAKGKSLIKIQNSLSIAKKEFKAFEKSNWEMPFYQYANRLAHLYFLRELNMIDSYLIFLYFINAPDVPEPAPIKENWCGAIRIIKKCIGIGKRNKFSKYISEVFIDLKSEAKNQI